MELPEEVVKVFAPKVRNLTLHKVHDVKIRIETHNECNRSEGGCEIVLDIREARWLYDPRIDVILIPGEFTDEIESEGLESALTSEDERLRSVAILMKEFTSKKLCSPRKAKKSPILRWVPKSEEDVDIDDEDDSCEL